MMYRNKLRHGKQYTMWPKTLQSLIGTFYASTMISEYFWNYVIEELPTTVSRRAPDKEAGQSPSTIVPNSLEDVIISQA